MLVSFSKCNYKRIYTLYKRYMVQNSNLTCRWWITCREGIANESRVTSTDGAVALDRTTGMDSTHTGTRVFTLISDTSQVYGTIGIDGTFWLALDVRISLQARETSARCCPLSVPAFGIDATR